MPYRYLFPLQLLGASGKDYSYLGTWWGLINTPLKLLALHCIASSPATYKKKLKKKELVQKLGRYLGNFIVASAAKH